MRNEVLILKYLPLAKKLGSKYGNPNFDAEQEAYYALVLAAQKFDKQRGGSFPLFAEYAIRNRLKRLSAKRMPKPVDWQEIESAEDGDGNWLAALKALAVPAKAEDRLIRREFVRLVITSLTRAEKRLLLLLLRGESQKTIGERLGYSQPTASRKVKALGTRAKEIIGAYEGGSGNQGG